MIRTIIIEDEKDGQDFLIKSLAQCSKDVIVVAVDDNVDGAIEIIDQLKPDLVFMDIEIINGTGFDVLERLTYREFEIIFVTAYNQYAIKAIKENAFDYILKPIVLEELKRGIDKIILKINLHKESVFSQSQICVPTSKGNEFVFLKDIQYLEASGNSTILQTTNKKIISSKLIGYFETVISSNKFFRCHNSFIVNVKFVQKLIQQRSGVLVMSNGDNIPVAQRKMKFFKHLMKCSI